MAQARSISTNKVEEKTNMTHGTLSPSAGEVELRIDDLEHWHNWQEVEVRVKRMLEALREDVNAGGGHASPRGEGSGHFWT